MKSQDPFATSGLALVVQIIVQIAIGIFLATRYVPTLDGAHASVQTLREQMAFVQNLHYWGSQVLIAHSLLHVLAMVWAGRYRQPYRLAFLGGLAIFAAAFLFQLTGNLLPMDRHDVQTAVIETGIGSSVPIVGGMTKELMFGGSQFGQATLDNWFFAHRYIATALALAGIVFLLLGNARAKVRASGIAALAPLVCSAVLASIVAAPFGAAARAQDYSEQATLVSWYTWPLHGALKAAAALAPGMGWLGAAVLPGLFAGFLVSLPLLSKRIPLAAARAGLVLFLGIFGLAAGIYGGPFARLTGNQDPPDVRSKAPVGGASPIDAALAAKGKALFAKLPCSGCHGANLQGGPGGPSLMKVFEKQAEPAWYKRFIKDPASVKPGSVMPAFGDLSEAELSALAEYLRQPR